jgi:hypothetical protein
MDRCNPAVVGRKKLYDITTYTGAFTGDAIDLLKQARATPEVLEALRRAHILTNGVIEGLTEEGDEDERQVKLLHEFVTYAHIGYEDFTTYLAILAEKKDRMASRLKAMWDAYPEKIIYQIYGPQYLKLHSWRDGKDGPKFTARDVFCMAQAFTKDQMHMLLKNVPLDKDLMLRLDEESDETRYAIGIKKREWKEWMVRSGLRDAEVGDKDMEGLTKWSTERVSIEFYDESRHEYSFNTFLYLLKKYGHPAYEDVKFAWDNYPPIAHKMPNGRNWLHYYAWNEEYLPQRILDDHKPLHCEFSIGRGKTGEHYYERCATGQTKEMMRIARERARKKKENQEL